MAIFAWPKSGSTWPRSVYINAEARTTGTKPSSSFFSHLLPWAVSILRRLGLKSQIKAMVATYKDKDGKIDKMINKRERERHKSKRYGTIYKWCHHHVEDDSTTPRHSLCRWRRPPVRVLLYCIVLYWIWQRMKTNNSSDPARVILALTCVLVPQFFLIQNTLPFPITPKHRICPNNWCQQQKTI